MRFLVTGAAGFIGSHLQRELLARGHHAVGVDAFTPYYDPSLKTRNAEGLEVMRLDLSADTLDLSQLDGIFHLAGQPGVRSFGSVFPDYVRDNVIATQRVFEAAADANVKVVFASTSSIYGNAEAYPTAESTPPRPISPYGITKLACEHLAYSYAQEFQLNCSVVRYFTVYGPGQRPDMAFTRLTRALARDETFVLFGDGNQSRGFTYVSDAVDATIRVMERGKGVYNVGGADEATMNEVIDQLETLSGRRLRVERRAAAKGDVRRTNANTERLRQDLGWAPQVPLSEGLAAQWEWAAGLAGST